MAGGTIYEDVHDALVTKLAAQFPSVQVVDGDPVDDTRPLSLCIGTERLNSAEPSRAATISQSWAQVGQGGDRDETGNVECVIEAFNGNSNAAGAKAARTAALNLLRDVGTYLGTNYNLDALPGLLWVSVATDAEVLRNSDDYGSRCIVRFTIAYQARI